MHLVVVPCRYSHEAWDMALTYYGDFLSESEPHRVTRICKTRVVLDIST